MTLSFFWILQAASVAFMTGLIWLIQCVHYPLMSEVSRDRFQAFHASHSARITWIVAPVMVAQLCSAAFLVFESFVSQKSLRLPVVCLVLSLGVFAATALLSVPQHALLARGFDARAHTRLVRSNWVRTVIWSVHLAILIVAAISASTSVAMNESGVLQ
ncbi:MAG: hypothetical protein RJB38_1206 [Pseudomonadota bacterium]|jgi:hypothetical protein